MSSKDSAREKRLAEALRENLKRRKAASRARAAKADELPPEPLPETAVKTD